MSKVFVTDGAEGARVDLQNERNPPVSALARDLTVADLPAGVAPTLQPGEVIGLQVDAAGPGLAVPLTGLEQGENVRFHSRQVFGNAGLGVTLALNPNANVLEKTSGASVELVALTGGAAGRIVFYQHVAGGGSTTTFAQDSGGAGGFLCPNGEDFVCGGSVASGGTTLNQAILFYDPNQDRWMVFPRGLTGPELRGVGLTVDALGTLRPRLRPRRYSEIDYFVSGPATGATGRGKLNWSVLGTGAPTLTRGSSSFVGNAKQTLSTSGALNDRASLVLGDAENRTVVLLDEIETLQCHMSFNGSLANKRFFFGFNGNFAVEPGTMLDGLGIYFDSAVSPTNLIVVSRSGGVGVPVVTSFVASASNSHLLTLWQTTPGTWELHASHTTQTDVLIATISSGLTVAALNLGFRLETLTAASATARIGYCGWNSAELTGVYNDDNFLES